MYLGPPGLLLQVRDPKPDFDMPADRGGATNTTLSGGMRVDFPGKHPRTFSPSWDKMSDDEYALLEKIYLRQIGPGPFILIPEPARWNYLTGEQSSGAETGNVSAVTLSSGVLTSDTAQSHSFFRSYKWATTAINGATFVNNAPNNALPLGFVTNVGMQWCFSGWVRTDTASQTIIPQINWYTSTGAYISTSGSSFGPAANTWTQVYVAATAPATAVYGVTQYAHATGTAVNIWVDDQMLEYGKTSPGSHLAGRGQPLVSFTKYGETYNWANYNLSGGQHSADGEFLEVS